MRIAVACLAAACLLSALAAGAQQPPACTINWTNVSGGDWSTAANWDLGRVPVAADSVCITTPGTYSVTTPQDLQPVVVGSLQLGGSSGVQTLILQGPLTISNSTAESQVYANGVIVLSTGEALLNPAAALEVAGTINWVMGTFGEATEVDVLRGGTVNYNAKTPVTLSSFLYVIEGGTLNINSTQPLRGAGPGQIAVLSGLIDITVDTPLSSENAEVLLVVAGTTATMRKSGGKGTFRIGKPFRAVRGGTLDVQSGTLEMAGPFDVDGTVTVDDGATLLFDSTIADAAFSAGSTISGGGTIVSQMPATNTVTIAGDYSVASTNINGRADLGDGAKIGGMVRIATTAAQPVTVHGNATFTERLIYDSGTIAGQTPEDVLIVGSGATMEINATGALSCGAILNRGTINFPATANPFTGTGVANAPGGTINLSGTAAFDAAITNGGTVIKSGSGRIEVAGLSGIGRVNVDSGILVLDGSFDINGPTTVGSGAGVELASGSTHSFGAASTLAGAGMVSLVPGRALTFAGSYGLTGTFHVHGAATFNVDLVNPGTIVVGKDVDSVAGSLTVNGGCLQAAPGASLELLGGGGGGPPALTCRDGLHLAGGTLTAAGSITGNVVNHGATVRIAPPGATGKLTISGSYAQEPMGTLSLTIGGTSAGVDSDLLAITGPATFAGTLAAGTIRGYAPPIPASFAPVTYASVSGGFTTEALQYAPGRAFTAAQGATNLTLTTTASQAKTP